jgi:CubicO group peptidase (beta-lactamase class C family)
MRRARIAQSLIVMSLAVMTLASTASAQESAVDLLQSYFAALNAGDHAAMVEFYEDGVTEEFRNRRSVDEDRAFYERIRNDLGTVKVEELRRAGPAKAVATVRSERMEMPVEFTFDLVDGRIGDLSVRIGGPPGGRAAVLELPESGGDAELVAALDRQLVELAAADRFTGVVLLARDGEPFFHRGYGPAERRSGRAIDTGTRFDVGSITKLLTRIAIGQLAQDGKLELEDPIAEHLPDYPDAEVASKVTIQHLLDHSSGLGDIFNERWMEADKRRFIQPEEFFPLFAGRPLLFEPGERRSYSNAGFVTLGAIVAAVSGQPYFDYVAEKIFTPAAMKRSGFPVRDGSDPSLAIGYTRGGPTGGHTGAGGPLEPNLGMLPTCGCPAGSSSHTAEDLLALDRALRSGKLLDEEWTAWAFHSAAIDPEAGYEIGVAGGGPGVSAGYESEGDVTAIVLASLDPPAGEGLALELFRALASARGPGRPQG